MKNYQGHLKQFDRDRIQAMKDAGMKQCDIAKVLGRDPSVISNEIKRNRRKIRSRGGNKDGPYEAFIANHKAYVRRRESKYQGLKILVLGDGFRGRFSFEYTIGNYFLF